MFKYVKGFRPFSARSLAAAALVALGVLTPASTHAAESEPVHVTISQSRHVQTLDRVLSSQGVDVPVGYLADHVIGIDRVPLAHMVPKEMRKELRPGVTHITTTTMDLSSCPVLYDTDIFLAGPDAQAQPVQIPRELLGQGRMVLIPRPSISDPKSVNLVIIPNELAHCLMPQP